MKKTYLFTLFTLLSGFLVSQNAVILNQYHYNLFAINPAYAGFNNHAEANMYYKKLWSGFTDSPDITQITLTGPFRKNKMGLGFNASLENVGIFSRINASFSYSYKIKLTEKSNLSFGLALGIKRQQINTSKINAQSPEEFTQLPSQQAYTLPNIDFGLVYSIKNWQIFLAANQLLSGLYQYRDASYQSTIRSQTIPYYLGGFKWVKKFNDTWAYSPVFILRSTQGLPVQIDVSNTLTWRSAFYLGVGYRQSYNLYANIGYQFTNSIKVGYSYEYTLNNLNPYTRGGHEVWLSFVLQGKGNGSSNNNSEKKKDLTELYEKTDKDQQQIEETNRRVDSLDKNLNLLKQQLEKLKQNEVSKENLEKIIESVKQSNSSANKFDNGEKKNSTSTNEKITNRKRKLYSSIHEKEEAANVTDNPNSNYSIVLGVYQIFNYAKEYQKILKREFFINTKLIQLDDDKNNYNYVVMEVEFNKISEALNKMDEMRDFVTKQKVKVTNGQPWILISTK